MKLVLNKVNFPYLYNIRLTNYWKTESNKITQMRMMVDAYFRVHGCYVEYYWIGSVEVFLNFGGVALFVFGMQISD